MIHKLLYKLIPKNLPAKRIVLIRDIISIVLMLIVMIPLTIMFDNWYFAVIGSIVINSIQFYTYSFHCKNLDNCVILTNCLFLAFGYISKQSLDYLWVVFLVCLFCIKDIYIKTPLKLIVKNKDKYWHKMMYIKFTILFICIAFICLNLGFDMIASCIFYTFIMSDLMLFLNEMKERL